MSSSIIENYRRELKSSSHYLMKLHHIMLQKFELIVEYVIHAGSGIKILLHSHIVTLELKKNSVIYMSIIICAYNGMNIEEIRKNVEY